MISVVKHTATSVVTIERFIIEDLGIHILDVARFLFGDVARVTARTRRVNPAVRGEDVATILLDHENGVTSVVDCSYATLMAVESFPETLIEVDGAEGSIRLNQGYDLVVAGMIIIGLIGLLLDGCMRMLEAVPWVRWRYAH